MGFARCGVEGNLRNILENACKNHFIFFCKFEKMKMVFARDLFSSRLSVCSSPHLAKPLSVACNPIESRQHQQADKRQTNPTFLTNKKRPKTKRVQNKIV